MEHFDEWINAQRQSVELIDQLYSLKSQNLDEEIRLQYSALFNIEEKARKLNVFSDSLAALLHKKDEITGLLPLLSENTVIKITGPIVDGHIPIPTIPSQVESTQTIFLLSNEINDLNTQLCNVTSNLPYLDI